MDITNSKDTIGRGGDFITSVSTGELLASSWPFQFAGWLDETRIADDGGALIMKQVRMMESSAATF